MMTAAITLVRQSPGAVAVSARRLLAGGRRRRRTFGPERISAPRANATRDPAARSIPVPKVLFPLGSLAGAPGFSAKTEGVRHQGVKPPITRLERHRT